MRWFSKTKKDVVSQHRPDRELPERIFDDRDIPMRAQIDRNATTPRIWQNAVWLYHSNLRPDTGRPWNGTPDEAATRTLELAFSACQTDAVALSAPEDEANEQLSAESSQLADAAIDEIGRAKQLLDDSVPNTDGGMSTAREVIQSHRADEELTAERARAGDTRHLQKPVEPVWITIAAVVLALVDVLLLWKPVLGLGIPESSDMLLKWTVAGGGSVLVAWFIDRTVWKYHIAERDKADRRAALLDYRRRRRPPLPDLKELTAADRKLITAYVWLVFAATLTGVASGVRLTILAQNSGMPTAQAALFGAVIGIMLGGAVVMLGYCSCRGNWLGDRLRLGAKIVTDIDATHRRNIGTIETHRESAREAMTEANTMATRAEEIRNSVISQYQEAVLLCWGWAGFDRKLMQHPGSVSRPLPIAERAASIRQAVPSKLAEIDHWLTANSAPIAQVTTTRQALQVGAPSVPVPTEDSPSEPPYQRLPELPDEPTTPILWLAAGAIITALAAVITAWLTGSNPISPP